MLSFTILRSSKSGRCTVYNQYGTEFAKCASLNAVFDYFYNWCDKLACKSVIYSQTADKNIIRVKIDCYEKVF